MSFRRALSSLIPVTLVAHQGHAVNGLPLYGTSFPGLALHLVRSEHLPFGTSGKISATEYCGATIKFASRFIDWQYNSVEQLLTPWGEHVHADQCHHRN